MSNRVFIFLLCIFLLMPFLASSGVLTRGRILFETSGYKDQKKAARPEMEPGTGLQGADESKVLIGYEFWDSSGKRHTGIYIPPDAASVLFGTSFGPNGEVTGSYRTVTSSNVRSGVAFGNSQTGILVLPATNTVLSGISYGANGSEFSGTYIAAGNDPGTVTNDASIGFVLTNREFWTVDGKRHTGKYYPVSASNVRGGITFGSNKSLAGLIPNRGNQTGVNGLLTVSLSNGLYEGKIATARDTDLASGNIRKGINLFGTNGTFVGTPVRTGQIQIYRAGDDGSIRMGWHDIYTNADGTWNGTTRFSNISGGNIVKDNLTGLMWLRNANTWGLINWNTAIDNCNSLSFSGFDDWRLPNVQELMTLKDYKNSNPALPTGHPFLNVVNDYYWTSTTYILDTAQAWVSGFAVGIIERDLKTATYTVIPVRGGK